MLLLNVPYEEKDEAKALGAKWKPEYKKWLVFSGKDYKKFDKWISRTNCSTIICEHIYIVVGERICYKCHKSTTVIGMGVDKHFSITENELGNRIYDFSNIGIHIWPFISELPNDLLDYLAEKYKLKNNFSKFTQSYYIANHCDHCSSLQGNNYLFSEVNSPFWIESVADIQKLTIYEYKLPFDILCNAEVSYCSTDPLLKKYAKIQSLNL